MKRSLNELSSNIVETNDGKTANVKDFLFDEKEWRIRYMDADFGGLFTSKKILIPKAFFKQPPWESNIFPTEISSGDIENCPKVDDHLPVSREYENILHEHYELDPYWGTAYIATSGSFYPPRPIKTPEKDVKEENIESILRSFKEIIGYKIKSLTDVFGQIDDILIDDVDWQIVYLVIDTKSWVPWSKRVIIAVDWLDEISYTKHMVKLNLTTESIKDAPEFVMEKLVDEKFEKSVFDFYHSSLLK